MNNDTDTKTLAAILGRLDTIEKDILAIKRKQGKLEDALDDYNKNYIRINTKMWKINSMAISTKDRLGILESSLMRIKQK